jgi:hypothetical protein
VPSELQQRAGLTAPDSFVAEHHDSISVNKEFVSLKHLSFPRTQRFKKLLDSLPTAPRASPRDIGGGIKPPIRIVRHQFQDGRNVSLGERLVDVLDRLKVPHSEILRRGMRRKILLRSLSSLSNALMYRSSAPD